MIIYPAIDIKDGKCVRLLQGRFSDMTVYSDDPVETAKRWVNEGGEFIHLVDLDGAKSGLGLNLSVIKKITAAISVPVQLGGGIRDDEAIKKAFECGVQRVIIGTAAVSNSEFVKSSIQKYGNRIAVGIDAKDGFAAVEGWQKVSKIPALELAKKMEEFGVEHIIYTDIDTDGMLNGPNLPAMKQMAEHVKCNIIASGGASCIDDIIDLQKTNVSGIIIGKALYDGKINLKKALEALI